MTISPKRAWGTSLLFTLLSTYLLLFSIGCGASTNSSGASGASDAALARLENPGVAAPQGPFSVGLRAGWNGVGLRTHTVTSVSDTAEVAGMATWNGTSYETNSALTPGSLNAGQGTRRGMWIFASAPTSFTYSGESAAAASLDLHRNWNLVAFPTAGEPLGAGALTVRRAGSVVALNSVLLTQFYEIGADNDYTVVDMGAGGQVRPGRAYWVFSLDDVVVSYNGEAGPAASPGGSASPSASASPGSSPTASPGGSASPSPLPSPVASVLPTPGGSPGPAGPAINLRSATSFAVLAGSTVTSTGETRVIGDLGVFPGTGLTGFPPGTVTGTLQLGTPAAQQAQLDLTTAFNEAMARAGSPVAVAGNLGGQTLTPALYKSTSSLAISSGDLTLDGVGNPDGVFIFQMASTLTVTSGRRVILTNGAKADNVFWTVGSSATLGTGASFTGNLIVDQSISFATGTVLTGRALTRVGAVTLESNILTRP